MGKKKAPTELEATVGLSERQAVIAARSMTVLEGGFFPQIEDDIKEFTGQPLTEEEWAGTLKALRDD
jgi:hypothetical protein